MLKLSVSILSKILSNEFLIYVSWMLECYSSCLIIFLSALAKSLGKQLPPGDQCIQPTMLCVNKGTQSNMFAVKKIFKY